MKYCPNCKANVEGLIHHCVCCGALLEKKKKQFFTCGIYELPQCFGFSKLTREMIEGIQPADIKKYEPFIEEVGIRMVCYPEAILIDGNIKNQLFFSQKKKYARMTIVVSYKDFISAKEKEKASLVAKALLDGIHLLEIRLRKSKLSIEEIVANAEILLKKYIN